MSHTGFCEGVGGGTVNAAAKGVELSDTTTDVSDEVPPRMLGGEDECAPMTVAARTRRMNWPDMVRAGGSSGGCSGGACGRPKIALSHPILDMYSMLYN